MPNGAPLTLHANPDAGLTKLDDANDAGGRGSEACTLILTEGDSAKSLVVAGMSVAGRDKFGVYPLRCRRLLHACSLRARAKAVTPMSHARSAGETS